MRTLFRAEVEATSGGAIGHPTPGVLSAGTPSPAPSPLKCPLPGPAGKLACALLGEAVTDWVGDMLDNTGRGPANPVTPTDERAGIPADGTVPAPGGGFYFP